MLVWKAVFKSFPCKKADMHKIPRFLQLLLQGAPGDGRRRHHQPHAKATQLRVLSPSFPAPLGPAAPSQPGALGVAPPANSTVPAGLSSLSSPGQHPQPGPQPARVLAAREVPHLWRSAGRR